MSGTIAGAIKARETNLKRHGANFYAKIGQIGGRNGHTGGFAANNVHKTAGICKCASCSGRIGGKISVRGKAKK